MALKFTTTRQAAILNGVKVLVYSRSGFGKTTLCSTASDNIIISSESGLLALKNFDIPVIEITTSKDLKEAYQWAISSKEANKFATISLDSITDIGETILSHLKGLFKDPRQAYGELLERVLKVVKQFRDIKGKNVYMTAKEARFRDEALGRWMFGPDMPGAKLGPGLPYYYDEVFHLEIGQTDAGKKYRFLRTQPDEMYEAKDRSGTLDEVERPHLDFIFNKIKQGVK